MPKLSLTRTILAAASAAAVAAAASAPTAHAEQSLPKKVVIMADVGPAGEIFRDPVMAKHTAETLNTLLAALKLDKGDTLELRTFGNPSLFDRLKKPEWNRAITFSYRGAKVEDMASFIDQRIAALAQLAPEEHSDLMFALADLAPDEKCSDHDVTTVVLTNGLEVGEISGNVFSLNDIPPGSPFCGKAYFLGLWTADAKPIPGMKAKAQELFVQLAKKIGFADAEVVR